MADKATTSQPTPELPDVDELLAQVDTRRAEADREKAEAREKAAQEKVEARAKRQAALAAARTEYATELDEIKALVEKGVKILTKDGWQDEPELVAAAATIRQHIKTLTDPREDESEEEKERKSLVSGVMYQDAITAMKAVSTYEELLDTCRVLVFHGNLLTGPALESFFEELEANEADETLKKAKERDRFTVLGEKFVWPGKPADLKRAYYGSRDHKAENEGAKDRCGKSVNVKLEELRSKSITVSALLRDAKASGVCVVDVRKDWENGTSSDGVLIFNKQDGEVELMESHGSITSYLFAKDRDTEEKEYFVGQSWPHGQLPKKLYFLLLDSVGDAPKNGSGSSSNRGNGGGNNPTFAESIDPETQAAMYAAAGVHPDRVQHAPEEGSSRRSGGRPKPRQRGGARRLNAADVDEA